MMENQPPLISPDGSSNGNPPERCSCHLYSRDSTQQEQNISCKVKEEIKKEEDEVDVMESLKGHRDPSEDVKREPFGDTIPPDRFPRPLYSRDSTRKNHIICHHNQAEELKDLKVEGKEEEEETLVSGAQQSMEGGSPLYCQESTQEYHSYTHHYQGEELKDMKVEIKEEEEETLVSGDQQSMEEKEIIMKRKQEEPSLFT
ncbi:hypothetical protein AB205_0135310, partial [Aquarana catesbeiana]